MTRRWSWRGDVWQARLLLADPDGRWWTEEELDRWAAAGRRILNSRLLLDVRAVDLPCVGGAVDLSQIDGSPLLVGGLKRTHPSLLPPDWRSRAGHPICWVLDGRYARLYPAPPDGDVRVEYLPSNPQLPPWADAGVAFYVAQQAYNRYGPTQSSAKAERWQSLWTRWLSALRDIRSQLAMEVRR